MFKTIVEHFDALIVFDKTTGKNVYYNNELNSILNQEITNIEEFSSYLTDILYLQSTPIYETVKINNTSYLVRRKPVENYIIYHFEDNCYFNKIIDNIKQESIIDDLTSCYNKKETELVFRKMLSSYLRYKTTFFTAIMFDIDYFKKVNDTYGHLGGDFILKEIASLIRTHLRDSDIFGRVGGEEFIILLSQTKLSGALKLSQKLRELVESHQFTYKDTAIPITISLGVTSIIKTDSYFSIIDRLDTALYHSKNRGRNRLEYL